MTIAIVIIGAFLLGVGAGVLLMALAVSAAEADRQRGLK